MTTKTFTKAPAGLPLMIKAALPALPVIGGLPGIKHEKGALPDLTLERIGVTTDRAHLEKYSEVCGFDAGPALPATYPHIAAHSLHMSLMTDTSFPFAPMGAVHLRNAITQHRPIGREEVYDLRLRASSLDPHPKGQLVELQSEATIGDEVVWEETMTVFFRGKHGAGPEKTTPVLEGVEAPTGTTRWPLPENLGRTYGAVSGDRNPIHLHPLTAKAFGFPRHIAHGMWSKAHCLAQLDLPESFRVDVEFKKPILLPSTVAFGQAASGAGADQVTTFGVTGTTKPVTHLVGRVASV